MGTVASIDVRPPLVDPDALEDAVAWLHDVDRRFSPFRTDSEVSRLADRSLHADAASPDVRAILALADSLRERTDGYFDARRHRADGRLDPSGVVKGWAIDEAAAILRLAGARNSLVGAGGDVVASGRPAPGRPWRIGIRHPDRPDRVAAVLGVVDLAMATSALYERGAHIRDPHTGLVPTGLRSLTVVGPTLTMADAFATAAFAMGAPGIAWVARQPGYGAFAITPDDRVVWTPMVHGLLLAAALTPVSPGGSAMTSSSTLPPGGRDR
jgi:thiamine biosynthesis lipoprotein